jgi:5'-3' exonuclease/transcription antitermination factor NusG
MVSDEWVVLELTPKSEGENPDLLRRSIRAVLKDPEAEVFVPAAVAQVGEDKVIHYLVDGYVFVRHDPEKESSYFRLEGSRFVQSVLTESGKRLATVPNAAIERMRVQIQREVDQGIGVGDTVQIISGPYRNIEAQVIEEIPEKKMVQVYVRLRSKQSIVTLPRSFLQVINQTPLSGFFSRLTELRKWTRLARPVFEWPLGAVRRLQRSRAKLLRLNKWHRQLDPLRVFVFSYRPSGLDQLPRLWRRLIRLKRLTALADRLGPLLTFVNFYRHRLLSDERRGQLEAKLVELYWLEDVLERLRQHQREIEALAHRAAKRKKEGNVKVIQNLLVDGHNLAFRCLYAPGITDLKDSKGRPTGAILGFLRSLGSLRKRYPEARIYVTWDGSSQRRKAAYPDYKANRVSQTGKLGVDGGFNQVEFLRGVLPSFGVWQAFNPEEEADDVIATLVRGKLKSQHNLVFSSDRDMLALVTSTTLVLVPGVGSRKEVLHDPAMVKQTFGVPVDQVLQFRALCGDTSDNIPGVPRVPKKVLRSLIQAHGSVEGIYASGLTGLSKGQYERLRLAEPQVRLNVELMSLVDIEVSMTDPNPDVEGAAERLQDVGINPSPILKPFFGNGG